MKNPIKLLLLLLAIQLPVTLLAHDFEVDGIYYYIDGNEAAVTYKEYVNYSYISEYSGDVIIPSFVSYDGITYPVTSIGDYAFCNCGDLTNITIPNTVTTIGNGAFSYCFGLTSINIPNSVTAICENAFYSCSCLTSVVLSNSVVTIGDCAFYLCSELTNIDIPNSVTTIGDNAFDCCGSLSTVTIGNSVTSIGNCAFNNTYLQSITCLASAPPTIQEETFGPHYYSNSIYERALLNVPSNGSIIAYRASYSWNSFKNIQALSPYDFESEGLYYAIMDSITVMVTYRDDDYNSYSGKLIIPETAPYKGTTYQVNAIGDNAFKDCSSLTSVNIPKSIISISLNSFSCCSTLANITVDNGNTKYDSRNNSNAIIETNTNTLITGCKNTIIPNSVSSIGNLAFDGCSGLTNVIIPNSVTTIGKYAFKGCTGLTSITIPSSVVSIGSSPFALCCNLMTIDVDISNPEYDSRENCNAIIRTSDHTLIAGCKNTFIPNTVLTIDGMQSEIIDHPNYYELRYIGYGALSNLTMDHIEIPNSVTSIGHGAFSGSYINSIDYNTYECGSGSPDYGHSVVVWYIPDCYPFENCRAGEFVINSDLTYIPDALAAFSYFTNIIIPDHITSIGDYAFYFCDSLTSINIPDHITYIGDYAFYGCDSLTSINIPPAVSYIGNEAFCCYNLASVYISDIEAWCSIIFEDASSNPLSNGGHLYFDDIEVKDLKIPNSVTSISDFAFMGCSGLTSITIPNSVSSIGKYTFESCNNLTSVSIGDSVLFIDDEAFSFCRSLVDVYSYISDPTGITIGDDVFRIYPDDYSNRTLHVPLGSLEAYQENDYWYPYFGNIVEMDPNLILATSIELNQSAVDMYAGNSLQLTATVLPDSTTNKAVTWISSNETIATVDSTGLVTAHELGSAIITARTTDGSNLSATCVVTVKDIQADNYFVLPDTAVYHGDEITIPVRLNNGESIMAFQADIYLPEGFTLVTDEDDEPIITPSSRLTSDHVIMADRLNDGGVRVICYNMSEQLISGNDGDLFYITVATPNDAGGDSVINLRNGRLTTADYNEIRTSDAEAVLTVNTYTPGDVNDSRTVNVTDIVFTTQYIMQRNPSPFIFEAADMNGDGEITVTDIMLIARLILYPTRNAPMRAPAIAANDDYMSGKDVTLMPGETCTVSILLDNEMDYSAFQFDLMLPAGLTASNFQLTDRAGNHVLDVETLLDGKTRVLCYSPAIETITGNSGALLTVDVTAMVPIVGDITVDGIEMVTADCQTARFDNFTIGVNNNATAVNEVASGKTIARVDYFNVAGQQIDRHENGVTLVVTTYTDGTRTTTKLLR